MALIGQAKKDYQRDYQRTHQKEYRKRKGLIIGSNQGSNQSLTKHVSPVPVRPTISQLRQMVKGIESHPPKPAPALAPFYDWRIHKPGGRVRIWDGQRWVVTTVPGDEVMSTGQLRSCNLVPSLHSTPKPEPKKRKRDYAIK